MTELYGLPIILSDWLPTDKIFAFAGRIVMPSPAAFRREAVNALLLQVRPARRLAALHRWNVRHPRVPRRR
jgi:hypothetical protein